MSTNSISGASTFQRLVELQQLSNDRRAHNEERPQIIESPATTVTLSGGGNTMPPDFKHTTTPPMHPGQTMPPEFKRPTPSPIDPNQTMPPVQRRWHAVTPPQAGGTSAPAPPQTMPPEFNS